MRKIASTRNYNLAKKAGKGFSAESKTGEGNPRNASLRGKTGNIIGVWWTTPVDNAGKLGWFKFNNDSTITYRSPSDDNDNTRNRKKANLDILTRILKLPIDLVSLEKINKIGDIIQFVGKIKPGKFPKTPFVTMKEGNSAVSITLIEQAAYDLYHNGRADMIVALDKKEFPWIMRGAIPEEIKFSIA